MEMILSSNNFKVKHLIKDSKILKTERRKKNMKMTIINGFSLVENTDEMVILKNEVKRPIDIAKNPWLSNEDEYVTITKGRNHVLTLVKTNGKTVSITFGERGYTLISDNFRRLKEKAIEAAHVFGVLLEIPTTKVPDNVCIFYNDNYKMWQAVLTVNGFNIRENVWFTDAINQNDTLELVEDCFEIKFKELTYKRAQTGIDTWETTKQD